MDESIIQLKRMGFEKFTDLSAFNFFIVTYFNGFTVQMKTREDWI